MVTLVVVAAIYTTAIVGRPQFLENQAVVFAIPAIVVGNIKDIEELPVFQIDFLGRIGTVRFHRAIEATFGRTLGSILPLKQSQTTIGRNRLAAHGETV